jgi:hypothetical protein
MGLFVYFEGQEINRFNSTFGAFSTTYRPHVDLQHRVTISGYQTVERETFDILGQYWLNEAVTEHDDGNVVGVGTFLNHARNELNAIIYNVNYRGLFTTEKVFWLWGAKFQREDILDYLNEWKMVDSANFALPNPPDFPGQIGNPSRPPLLQNVYKSNHHLISNRYQGFLQSNFEVSPELALVAGIRASYWDCNKEFLISPRTSLTYAPKNLTDWTFRFATGIFYQPPFYRELRDLDGNLNQNIK